MAADDETVQVKTRVPAHQRAAWREAADELDMSQSEFVRTMVQAGRSGLESGDEPSKQRNAEEDHPSGSNPGGDVLEERVRDEVSERGVATWDELVESVLGDFEERLEEAIQESDDVRHSGPKGGYVLDDGE